MLPLNKERVVWISSGAAVALFIAFVLGFSLGRWVFPSPSVATEIVQVPEPIDEPVVKPPEPAVAQSAPQPVERPQTPPPATPPASAPPTKPRTETPSPSTTPAQSATSGKRFAIVAGSVPIGDTPATAREEAERRRNALRVKGFSNARIEEVTIPNKGKYFRIIAMEANYPSATVARNDIESMKRRGELTSAFPLLMEGNR